MSHVYALHNKWFFECEGVNTNDSDSDCTTMWSCNGRVTCPGCTTPLAQSLLGMSTSDTQDPERVMWAKTVNGWMPCV